jgi:hypothetical protein
MNNEDNPEDSGVTEAEKRDRVDEILSNRFKRVNLEHPAMAALYKEAVRHWMEQEELVER